MKKLAAILCLAALATGAYAQGTVTFANNPSTLISYGGTVLPSGAGGSYSFALLTATSGTLDPLAFSFGNLIATNQNAAGRMTAGIAAVAAGWAPGETKSFLAVGWVTSLGATWNPAWLTADLVTGKQPGFGISAIGIGSAGGGPTGLPALVCFGAAPSITTGFNIVPVPEPTTMALAGLGAAALLIFRRRK